MFNKIRRMYQLSKKDPEALKVLESLSDEQLKAVPEVVEGDGKAEFFGEGTEKEWEEQQKIDDGSAPWYERLKNL